MIVLRLHRFRVVAVCGFVVALAACASQRVRRESLDADAPVLEARRQWNAALLARDSIALAALVEDSAVHVSPRFTHIGRAAFLAQFLRAMSTRAAFSLVYATERVTACERANCFTATEFGTWSETWLEDGEPTEVSGTYYAIWRRHGTVWQIRSEVFATARCRGPRYCGS